PPGPPPRFPYATLFRSRARPGGGVGGGVGAGFGAGGGGQGGQRRAALTRRRRRAGVRLDRQQQRRRPGPAEGEHLLLRTERGDPDRKSTRLNSSHVKIS